MKLADYTTNMNVQDSVESLQYDINHHFDQLITEIENRRNRILDQLKSYTERKNSEIDFLNNSFNHESIHEKVIDLSCLRFIAQESLMNEIRTYGNIDEGRASANNSKASGIGLKYAMQNEQSQFKLKTFDKNNQLKWVEQDHVDVVIKNNDNNYQCIVQNKCNGVYDIFYELSQIGSYEIHIKINGHHLPLSPFHCHVIEKETVDFMSSELLFHEGTKSALLQQKSSITRLYSDNINVKAWKFKVTTADPNLSFKVGYTNNSRYIPDIMEESYCQFKSTGLEHKLSLPFHASHYNRYYDPTKSRRTKSRPERKQSSFERSSLTFFVILDPTEHLLHVAIEELGEEKSTHITDMNELNIPFIEIRHSCLEKICPRPLLTFY